RAAGRRGPVREAEDARAAGRDAVHAAVARVARVVAARGLDHLPADGLGDALRARALEQVHVDLDQRVGVAAARRAGRVLAVAHGGEAEGAAVVGEEDD